MARFLAREGERGYMFACARDERIIRPASEAIRQSASGKTGRPVRIHYLDPEQFLPAQLEQAARGAQGLIVLGLDEFLRAPDKIISFNFAREAINKLGIPILFWATQDTLARIGNLATDLYSQRRSVNVYFDELADITVPDPFLDSRFPENLRSAEETAQLELALELQKKQLQEAVEARLSSRRIALDYALPLAKAYADLDGYGEALSILEAYPPGEGQDWPPEQLPALGRIFRGAHRYPEAIKSFEEAVQHFGQLEEKQSELSIALSELGDIYKELGQPEKAQETYVKDLELSEQLAKDNPHSEQLRRDWGIAIEKLADLEKDLGKLESAQQRYEQSIVICEQLAKDNPHSEQLRRDLSVAYYKMGIILDRTGKSEEAAHYLARDLEICRVLYQTNPGKIQFAHDLAVSYENLAGRQPPPADAPQYRQEAERLWLELYERTGEPSFREKARKIGEGDSGG
ncbi:MAG: tetratricopeptide repeat protein [Phaeodactylibacter sp.]|nr:tetratricopeptide repeat protein [Phaeodactylibacter sp.]